MGLCLLSAWVYSQTITQTLRGRIIDNESHAPLAFVNLGVFADSVLIKGTESDSNGYFKLTQVPLGRLTIKATYLGYLPIVINDVIVNSGKETILTIEMEESTNTLKEVVVKAISKDQANNEMAVVSARLFSVEETNRYAGSRSDPGRMASSYAGVQGSDDSRNDIIIRGNSPLGVLWRIEGVDVPNPNHFATPGTTGGGVSILNSKVLANSDFLTGAFTAEYGNTISGVFDIKFRNGNNEKHEFTGQLGFLGTEITAEGPISRENKSSYLVAYRYSTLKLFESFKIKIGTDAVPNYQDISFKLNFPSKKGNLSVFGIGGLSKIAILVSTYTKPTEEIYGEKDKDQYYATNIGMIGLSKSYVFNQNTYSKFTLSYQKDQVNSEDFKVFRDSSYKVDSLVRKLGYNFLNGRLTANFELTKKYSANLTIKAGVIANRLDYDLKDSTYNEISYHFIHRLDYTGNTWLIQPFAQAKYKFSDKFSINGGLHGQYLSLNNSQSFEPRAGFRWNFKPDQSLSGGIGAHSQMQPYYIYYYHLPVINNNTIVLHNKELNFTRSNHYVLSYDFALKNNSRIKIETYFMHLYDVPVTKKPSAYSILNEGATFNRFFPDSLVNKGSGTNYGFEFTLEKFFSSSYYFLFTASLYDSKYTGSDGIERNTAFNGKYAVNLLAGKDFKLNKSGNAVLTTGFKISRAGGLRYTPVDVNASKKAGEIVEMDSLRNTKQFKDYFRVDFKLGIKINTKHLTHEIAFDLVNVLDTRNILSLVYINDPSHPGSNPIQEEYQLGFLPLFYYKIDF